MAVHGNTLGEVIENDLDAALASEVKTGLVQTPKRLSSRFFYDAEGSRIFQEIMHCPEYYLTRSEYEILETYKADLLNLFAPDQRAFDLVELGAGDGLKTKILLGFFAGQQADFAYAPVDISADALDGLVVDVRKQWPDLQLKPQHDDYFNSLRQLSTESDARRVVLFLGSNIGNFAPDEAVDFYSQLHDRLLPGDIVLTGFDLQKNPAVIHAAYNDRGGLTRDFNLNLLRRINHDLDATFDLDAFDHYETYNPETGEARSYLVSQKPQTVDIKTLDMTVPFEDGEIIHTEISRKFTRVQIAQLAQRTGFSVTGWFTDSKGYFADVVFVRQ
ncbi:L-histidine N(alpha)-methyltransferase [Spirosoma agri]|uniref:L-histidine N(Alpha)-methyltransferase n=1 Tax=Spirosoma agri TaxID=1987381 RepID=A0A6M0IKW0_9BACT|nr:L-histidine N(alpha)-methyltransferase [Spirosoma agri]NEU68926.1 L-histidine N(alpha)-methyltransferase [Spirosoma agri]